VFLCVKFSLKVRRVFKHPKHPSLSYDLAPCAVVAPPIRRHPPSSYIQNVHLDIKWNTDKHTEKGLIITQFIFVLRLSQSCQKRTHTHTHTHTLLSLSLSLSVPVLYLGRKIVDISPHLSDPLAAAAGGKGRGGVLLVWPLTDCRQGATPRHASDATWVRRDATTS